jgi:hypothetical protein
MNGICVEIEDQDRVRFLEIGTGKNIYISSCNLFRHVQ